MKYIIYAQGTMSNDGRENALYQRRGGAPIYTTGAYADRFDEAEADRITKYKGKYVWVKKAVRDKAVVDYDARTQEDKLTSYSLEFRKRMNANPKKKAEILLEAKAAYDNVVEDTDVSAKQGIKRSADKHWKDLQGFADKLNDAQISDMALNRADAIDRCISLGKKFIEHFDKIYKDPDNNAVAHWKSEMRTWLGDVKAIKLKSNHEPLLNSQIHDWFLTAGAEAKDFMKNPSAKEIAAYDDFAFKVLSLGVDSAMSSVKMGDSIQDKLIESSSEEALSKNIATEIKAGKDPKQAAAIAYSIQKENDSNMKDGLNVTVKLNGKTYKGAFNGISGADKRFGDVYIPELVSLRSGDKGVFNPDEGNYVSDGKFYFKMENLKKWNPFLNDYIKDSAIKDTKFLVHAYNDGKLLEEKLVNSRVEAEQLAKEFTKKYGEYSTSIKLVDSNITDADPVKVEKIIRKEKSALGITYYLFQTKSNSGATIYYEVTDKTYHGEPTYSGGGVISFSLKTANDSLDSHLLSDKLKAKYGEKEGTKRYLHGENDSAIKDADMFNITFERNGVYQSSLVKASSEEEAKQKFMSYAEKHNLPDAKIISVGPNNESYKPGKPVIDTQPVKVIAKKAMETQDGCSRHYLEVEDCDGKRFYMVTDEYDGCSRQFAGGGSIIQDKATLSKKYKDDLASGLTGVVKSVASGVREVKSALPKLDENTVDPSIYKAPLDEMIKSGKVKDGVSASAVDAILGVNNVAATKQLLKDAGIKYSVITPVVSTYQIVDGKCVKIDN